MNSVAGSGYLLIANGDAGSSEKNAVNQAEKILGTVAAVDTVWTSSTEELDTALATNAGRTVVVAGGDGSIHLLINRLDHAGLLEATPIGIVPLGTGNDLARGLDLALDPEDAAHRITDGTPRPLPLMRLSTGELVTNNAHIGLGVAAAERAASLKKHLGRLAYSVGALVAGVRYDPVEVSVEVDGRQLHGGAATAVFVALGPSAGGGHDLDDDVELREAVADVFVVTATGLTDRLRLLRHLATNDLPTAPSVLTDRGTTIAVTVQHPTRAELDGEFRTWSETVSLTVLEDAWRVVGATAGTTRP